MVKFFKHLVILSLLKLNLYFALKKKSIIFANNKIYEV